jgi:hypothetical protein
MTQIWPGRLAGWLAVLLLAGCGGGKPDDGITVSGTVTLDGQPLPAGQVVFEVANSSQQRIGGIDNGRFEVHGVPAGKVRAAVRTSMMQAQQSAEQKFAQKSGGKADKAAFVPVPAKYEDVSKAGLEYDVAAGKEIAIELKK